MGMQRIVREEQWYTPCLPIMSLPCVGAAPGDVRSGKVQVSAGVRGGFARRIDPAGGIGEDAAVNLVCAARGQALRCADAVIRM